MQPPSVLFGHCFRSDTPTAYASIGSVSGLGSNSFNFKDLSLNKSQQDYFSLKQVPASSPSASLAADLSQNFHIDKSPQPATPRRSLFANRFALGNGREHAMTTPPLPSSSPAPASDAMDMSPLPHKPPFVAKTTTDVKSPELDQSMDSPMSMTSPSAVPSPLQDSPSIVSKDGPHERRRPNFLRANLARMKTQSLQLGISRPSMESQAPPFKFASGASKTSTPSLEDMFGDSPPRERPTLRHHSSGISNPRLRPSSGHGHGHGHGSSHNRLNGSPGIRKSSYPTMRPRKQCRRSLSMFEHPDELFENEAKYSNTNAPLQSIDDIETTPSLQLPHFVPEDQADNLPRIDKSILIDLMNGKYNDRFDNVMIIDCRFEYEYEGGHINGAINYNDKEHLAAELFSSPKQRTALILHCEYSAHRAPIMARHIRHSDRSYNVDQYPVLTYPDLYILDGGYRAFFAEHQSLCYPQNYVQMDSKEHEFACERGLGKVKQRVKLDRAHTFAFGDHSPQMQDSPTGRCRGGRLLDSPFKEPSDSPRIPTRRMLSY